MNSPASLSLVSSSTTTLVGFVYRVFHVESGRSYIGQTQENPPSVRYNKHFMNGYSGAPKLQAAMKEVGRTEFKAEVLENHRGPSISELDILLRTREAILIEQYDAIENGYNCRVHMPGNTTSDKILWKIIMERRRKHPCDDCPYSACSEAGLRVHENKQHNGPSPFFCTWEGCSYRTKRISSLKEHTRRHTGEKPYACTVEGCDYKSVHSGDLTRHMIKHTEEKPYACTWEGCGFKTAYVSSMKDHMLIHTGEKQYACTVEGCDYKSAYRSCLRRHIKKKLHGQSMKNKQPPREKPYACTWEGCGYKAARASTLKEHIPKHTGEKAYACTFEGCDFKSPYRSCLNRHIKKKSHKQSKKNRQPPRRKSYACTWEGCSYQTKRTDSLKEHIRKHTGEKPRACTFEDCDYKTAYRSCLNRHIKKKHKKSKQPPKKKQKVV